MPECENRRPARSISTLAVLAVVIAAGTTWSAAMAQTAVAADTKADAKAAPADTAKPMRGDPTPLPSATKKSTERELLDDFVHYVNIDQRAAAAGAGQELLDRKLKAQQLLEVVETTIGNDKSRFEAALTKAMKITELEPIGAQIAKAYEQGKMERARDPQEIAKNIQDLKGTVRGKVVAQARLKGAGEYAMPQLLTALLDRKDPILQGEVSRLMVDMGRQAIIPLVTAAAKLEPTQQVTVIDVLGKIPYTTSAPFIADIAATTRDASVKEACGRAMANMHGVVPGGDPADLYINLAEAYYGEKSEITSFPGEEHQLIWNFTPGNGLLMSAIRTPVFHEAMAMRLAERAIELRPDYTNAVSLWIASNFKREIQTPQGYANPAYSTAAAPTNGPVRREAMYYAVAAGPKIGQSVLARALDTKNSPLARRAIAAIEQTAGTSGLVSDGSRLPLIESLTYPNRRVQYDAALALATSQPAAAFPGSERVVPTLASAIRDAGSQYAAIVTGELETYQALRKVLEKSGFRVLPMGKTLAELEGPIAETPGIDLMVIHNFTGDKIKGLVEDIRRTPRVSAVPVLALTSTEQYLGLSRQFDGDTTVWIRQSAMGEDVLTRAVAGLMESAAGGPIGQQEAKQYTGRSLAALRDLAISNNAVLKVEDAVLPLTAALGDAAGDSKFRIAEILSRINQSRAQRSLMDTALSASGDDRVAMMSLVSASAKRFGNQLEPRQVTRVAELAASKNEVEATSAAALLGSLSLPNSQLVPLILGSK